MRTKPWFWLAALALVPATAAPLLAQPQPTGVEFRVNGNTDSAQRNPTVAFNAKGNALVVWENDQNGLRGRFLDRTGATASDELALVANQKLPGVPARGIEVVRKDPAVAFLPSGEFLLAWTEETSNVSVDIFYESRQVLDRDVFLQRFSATGAAQGAPLRLNTTTGGYQSLPKVLVRGTSDVVVVWQSDARDNVGDGIFGRLYRPATSRMVGGELKLSSARGLAANAALAADGAGNFLVTWEASDGNSQGVFARFYDRSATPKGAEVRVNTTVAGLQRRPAVAFDKNGGWLVVWQGQAGSVKQAHVFGQFLGAGGNFVGPQFRISQGVGEAQISPAVAQVKGGNFAVAWTDWTTPFPVGLYAVEIDRLGNTVGDEVKINDRPINSMMRTSLASSDAGVLIPWEGFTTSNVKPGISARFLTF